MWFFRKKAKKKAKAVVRSPHTPRDKGELFTREEEVETLRAEGDPRWRRAAWTDLREAADQEEGRERLARAVSAMLRRK